MKKGDSNPIVQSVKNPLKKIQAAWCLGKPCSRRAMIFQKKDSKFVVMISKPPGKQVANVVSIKLEAPYFASFPVAFKKKSTQRFCWMLEFEDALNLF